MFQAIIRGRNRRNYLYCLIVFQDGPDKKYKVNKSDVLVWRNMSSTMEK